MTTAKIKHTSKRPAALPPLPNDVYPDGAVPLSVVALLPYDPDDYPPGPPDRCYGCWLLNSHQNSEATFEHLASGRRWCHACIEGLVSWEYDGVVEWANEGYPDDPTHIEWAGLTSWKPPADDERWPPEWLIAGADQHE